MLRAQQPREARHEPSHIRDPLEHRMTIEHLCRRRLVFPLDSRRDGQEEQSKVDEPVRGSREMSSGLRRPVYDWQRGKFGRLFPGLYSFFVQRELLAQLDPFFRVRDARGGRRDGDGHARVWVAGGVDGERVDLVDFAVDIADEWEEGVDDGIE